MDVVATYTDAHGRWTSSVLQVPVQDGTYFAPAELADGRDASAELTAWLASLPSGAIADLGGRTYRIETFVKLTGSVGLTVRNGTLVRTVQTEDPNFYYPKANPFLWFVTSTDCTVEDVSFVGTNTVPDQRDGFGAYLEKYEFDAAIRAEKFSNFTARRLNIDAVWGDGVQLQVGTKALVEDCTIDRIGRQGVTVIGSQVGVYRVAVVHGRRSLFDIEPDSATQGVSDVEIANCSGTAIGFPIASGGRGPVNNVIIRDNVFGNGSLIYVNASDGSRRANWQVLRNVTGNFGSPISGSRFYRVDGVRYEGNNINVVASQSRRTVAFDSCGGVCTIKDNQFGSGLYYQNDTPMADQQLEVSGNTPVQTLIVA